MGEVAEPGQRFPEVAHELRAEVRASLGLDAVLLGAGDRPAPPIQQATDEFDVHGLVIARGDILV